MLKRGWLIFILLIPIAFAGVTRDISNWNCPVDSVRTDSYVKVTLTQTGATTNYAVEELLEKNWQIQATDYSITDMGTKWSLTFFRTADVKTISYLLKTPANIQGTITGKYMLDNNPKSSVTGTSSFTVRENTCIPGTSDDRDRDGCGEGCGCSCRDCDDNDNKRYYGAIEKWCSGIDENCDNFKCCPPDLSVDDPGHYDGVNPYHVCNGLDDVEKMNFITAWFNGIANPALTVIMKKKKKKKQGGIKNELV